jgi:hypothetical protein
MKRIKLAERKPVLPQSFWSGQLKDEHFHGEGELYELVDGLGLVKKFDGVMDMGTMKRGKYYEVFKLGIYLSFQGDFGAGPGCLYAPDGHIRWEGECSNRQPAGSGTAKVVDLWEESLTFSGICINGKYEGTLSGQHVEYSGGFNAQLHPEGSGTLDYFGNFFDGTFVDHQDGTVSAKGKATVRESFLGQKIFQYTGNCYLDGKGIEFHGEGCVVLRRDTKYYFFKATFAHGIVVGKLHVFEANELDGDQTLLGIYDDLHTTITTYSADGQQTFDGEGYLEFDTEPVFVRDGYGCVYVRGKRRFTSACFNRDTYINVLELFDDEEKLMWQLQDANFAYEEHVYMDSFREWPYLNGFGTVFGSDGEAMYKIRFEHSRPLGIKALLTLLPCGTLSGNFTDPITLDSIAKNRVCVLINNNKTPLLMKSAYSMWEQGPMIDPLAGSVPGIRFRKVKIVSCDSSCD